MKSLLNRTAVSFLEAMPVRVAQHLLFLAQGQHDTLDRWGYHIRPVHYYEPLPDFRSITKERINRRREYPALSFNWREQLSLLEVLATYRAELEDIAKSFEFENAFFGGFDAAVYYALIRELKPRRIVEIGGGYSTRIAAKAVEQNRKDKADATLKCIEPYPEPRLDDALNEVELIQKEVQAIGLEFFSELQSNDILFIDSSHTVKFGSDVCYLFLEVLPALRAGVWIHVHDIFFPNDYPAEWLMEKRLALNEQYLLEAFLAFNRDFDIRLSNHWLCSDHIEDVRQLWPNVAGRAGNNKASSLWITSRRDR